MFCFQFCANPVDMNILIIFDERCRKFYCKKATELLQQTRILASESAKEEALGQLMEGDMEEASCFSDYFQGRQLFYVINI